MKAVEVEHPFSPSSLSRFASHLCRSGSVISLALDFEYKTCMHSLSSLWTSTPFAREIFFTVFSSSAFCTRCSQALNSCTSMTHSPSFSCRDTFSWASSFWMSVSFFSSSSNWDYISQKVIWWSRFAFQWIKLTSYRKYIWCQNYRPVSAANESKDSVCVQHLFTQMKTICISLSIFNKPNAFLLYVQVSCCAPLSLHSPHNAKFCMMHVCLNLHQNSF